MVYTKIRKEIRLFCLECDVELTKCIICNEPFGNAENAGDCECTSEGHVHVECLI